LEKPKRGRDDVFRVCQGTEAKVRAVKLLC
jgi:hypothetical protein